MNKVIAICGRICSGKTHYADKLKKENKAVILSCDEITWYLFDNNLGDKHDAMASRIKDYLLKKATDIISTDTDVILDWGFWKKEARQALTEYFNDKGIIVEWHYIDISDEDWAKNIEERNGKVLLGQSSDYYVDEGLLNKFKKSFIKPERTEIDVWYNTGRKNYQ